MNKSSGYSMGITYTIAAYAAWGTLPLYWYLLKELPAIEVFAHRILWSFVFASVILFVIGGWKHCKQILLSGAKTFWMFIAAILISTNWLLFIWAVSSSHVIEASLGYYISPLFSVILGIIFLREKLDLWKNISLLLAIGGVVVIMFQLGGIPWISIVIASSFALYGLVKKLVKVESIASVTLETMFILPIVLFYLFYIGRTGDSSFGHLSLPVTILLIGGGVVTALPLVWFAKGAQQVSLTTLGFLQYINPTLQLLVGVFIFQETFTRTHFMGFSLIWCALLLFSFSQLNLMQRLKAEPIKKVV
ncbi:EamA family transporter RarD [Bacillus horti]|uniref:Chloramphenicol-sensitive protein RarD n=1 Tax=Caldalkalibacillus horti TaxID=77523 RepID=A0ABT9W1T1_9BACI|nr:EamA family transporter RarD [Bacillus horti]MDQ0167029.1 chloramphenicol-sensitive protein RarD [Bacillus horti]